MAGARLQDVRPRPYADTWWGGLPQLSYSCFLFSEYRLPLLITFPYGTGQTKQPKQNTHAIPGPSHLIGKKAAKVNFSIRAQVSFIKLCFIKCFSLKIQKQAVSRHDLTTLEVVEGPVCCVLASCGTAASAYRALLVGWDPFHLPYLPRMLL